jgi:hypothetical protein
LNEDGTLNGPSNPAALDSVIQIYGTGMGPYDRALADGSIVGPPLANLTTAVQATFPGAGGCQYNEFNPFLPICPPPVAGAVVFAGAAPLEVVGVDQINVLIPSAVAQGATTVTLLIGTASLPMRVYLN